MIREQNKQDDFEMVRFQVLQREREKEVGGLLQLAATLLGFVVMLIVQVALHLLQSFVFS